MNGTYRYFPCIHQHLEKLNYAIKLQPQDSEFGVCKSALCMLTTTIESIVVQLVAYVTATVEATNGVIAPLFTASITCITLIDIYII